MDHTGVHLWEHTHADAPTLWPPDGKNWLIGKDPDAGRDWRQKETGKAEDEMIRQHHQLNRHELEQTPGESGEQSSVVGWSSGGSESDWTTLRAYTGNYGTQYLWYKRQEWL